MSSDTQEKNAIVKYGMTTAELKSTSNRSLALIASVVVIFTLAWCFPNWISTSDGLDAYFLKVTIGISVIALVSGITAAVAFALPDRKKVPWTYISCITLLTAATFTLSVGVVQLNATQPAGKTAECRFVFEEESDQHVGTCTLPDDTLEVYKTEKISTED